MKTTMVPAQITTVEDKIAGNLSLQQLMLLCAPIFISGAIYAILPPFVHLAAYKFVMFVVVAIVCAGFAIRIRGNLVINWILIIGRYNARARFYIFNKNDDYLRTPEATKPPKPAKAKELVKLEPQVTKAPLPQMRRLQEAINDSRLQLHFRRDKKGGMNVYITEVE